MEKRKERFINLLLYAGTDRAMYESKAAYYKASGKDRRKG